MGLLGKYVAARWASRGPGGPDGGADGGGGLALFALIVGGIMAVFLLLGYVLTGVGSFVYGTVRPVLMVAPTASVVVGGVLLGGLLAVVPRYPPETARKVLTSDGNGTDTGAFYARNLSIVGLMFVVGFVVVRTEGGLAGELIQGVTDSAVVLLVGNLAYAGAFFYVIYKFFHLPYRYHRLLRYAPYGTVYTIVTLFPVTATVVISAFDLPVEVVDAPLSSPIAIAFLAGLVTIPYALPLAFVKFRAEPRILTRTGPDADGRQDT